MINAGSNSELEFFFSPANSFSLLPCTKLRTLVISKASKDIIRLEAK